MKTRALASAAVLAIFAVLFAGSLPARGTEPAARFEDPVYGFRVDIPAIGEPAPEGTLFVQRLTVAGPGVDGFAPNCNIQVQFTDMGLDAFLDVTRQQFDDAGVEATSTTRKTISGRPAASIDYQARLGELDLSFAALAVVGKDRVWLVTCTATTSTFARHRKAFDTVLDSFEVTAPAD